MMGGRRRPGKVRPGVCSRRRGASGRSRSTIEDGIRLPAVDALLRRFVVMNDTVSYAKGKPGHTLDMEWEKLADRKVLLGLAVMVVIFGLFAGNASAGLGSVAILVACPVGMVLMMWGWAAWVGTSRSQPVSERTPARWSRSWPNCGLRWRRFTANGSSGPSAHAAGHGRRRVGGCRLAIATFPGERDHRSQLGEGP